MAGKHPKFVMFRGRDRQFYFHLTASNGETIAQSEGYTTKAACQNGIRSVKTNAPDAPVEDTTQGA